MKKLLYILSTILFVFVMACNDIKEEGMFAEFHTNLGTFTCQLYFDKTPVTVGNFVGLVEGTREFTDYYTKQKVKRPFYNGLIFHRVIKGFMIQGGCPKGDGTGSPGEGSKFIDEFVPELKHDSEGILSMANAGPNTNGSQFFVTLAPTPHLDGKHTVFGKVVNGMDIVKKIGAVQVDKANKPYDDVFIKKITIIRNGEKAKAFDAEKAFAMNSEKLKQQKQAKEEKMKGFLKELGVDENKIIELENGLKYFVKKDGTGNSPKKGEVIVAHYAGYLEDGTKFDSSYDRKQPFETAIGVGRVIAGWDEAFLTMKPGEKRVLILPYYLAYGERGYPPVIPAKATLIFDVELLDIK